MKYLNVVLLAAFVFATPARFVAAGQSADKSHGLDLAGMDRSVEPGDDFFRYANGGWLRATPIPPDRSGYGAFAMLDEEGNRRTADLIRAADKAHAPAGSEMRQIGDYYAAYMDEQAIEAKGLTPIKAELDQINAI